MEGRQGRGRPRTRARNHIEDSPTEAVDRRSEAEPAGGQGRDRDLDDRLIAAYERGRQAERRDATVGRYHRQYLDRLDGGISMIVDTPMAIELQAMMDHAEQVELHSRRRMMQLTERNVKQREDQNRQIRSGGGPSTARSPPRQVATPVLQPDFVPMWCRSCNQAHREQECRRRNRACYTCGSLEHFTRECPQAAGPSTARSPPRQVATPVLQPEFVPMWCRSCNQAHPEQDCRRRSRACFTCGGSDHWRRECPQAAGPSTARPPPRQVATPVLQPDFVPMWCRSCNHAHSQQDCRRRNSACFTCGNLEHWARQCPNAALGFPRDGGNRGPTGRGQGGPTFSGRSVPQHGGGRTGGRMSGHALGISEASYDAAGTLEEGDGSKPSDSRDDGMTGIISISNVVGVLCDRYRVEPVHSIGNLRREM